MKVNGKHYRTIWADETNNGIIHIIDQRFLPHEFKVVQLQTSGQMCIAIKEMHVRGAGLLGAAAGYGMYLGALEANESTFDHDIHAIATQINSTRPTAVNINWAVKRQLSTIKKGKTKKEKVDIALQTAIAIADEDAMHCRQIGLHGLKLITEIANAKPNSTVNILTHCNAGWLAFVDHGTALSPIYVAHEQGIDLHVWVDETRPRNQGSNLTAWELGAQNIKHTIITDNAGGHLMQHGLVDLVLVGSDRTTLTGDVANKTGTYLKALAAKDNNIPFYAALPSSSIDWELHDGYKQIPIEERDAEEVKYVQGYMNGTFQRILISPENSPARNPSFDVTPARLVTGLITERGICEASSKGLLELFPEKNPQHG